MTKDEKLMQQALDALDIVKLRYTQNRHVTDAITALRERLAQPSTCRWKLEDADYGTWASGCGEVWVFNDGGPDENGVRYCHGCGKPVEIVEDKP